MNDTPWPGFFLVGTGRCGSSMLRKLISEHADVHVPQETHWIPILYDFFGLREIGVDEFVTAVRGVYMAKGKTAYNRILRQNDLMPHSYLPLFRELTADLPVKNIATLTSAFLADIARRNGATLWGEKTPDHGQCMGLLRRLWPEARFVHIHRDGRDVALSMTQVRSFRFQVAWDVCYWPTIAWNMAYAARSDQVDGDLPLEGFFELWRRRLLRTRDEASRLPPGCFLEIDYRDLLSDPRGCLETVHDHLRLPGDRDWIERAAASVRSDNAGKNVDRPEYHRLTERFGETLREMGYVD